MDNSELVLNAFKQAGKALRPGEVAEAAGVEKVAAEKAIKDLLKKDLIYSPKRCFYEVKK